MSYDEEEDDDTHEDADLEGAQDAPDEDDNDASVNRDEAPDPPGEENGAAATPPAIEDNNNNNCDDNDDDEAEETDTQQPMEVGQPDNLAHQDDANDEDNPLEIPGVDDETIDPETQGVGKNGEEMEEEELMNQPPTVSPQRNGRRGGRYNLCNTRGHDYDHRYAGDDFNIDNVAMTMHGTSEVLEMPQMSLKEGL